MLCDMCVRTVKVRSSGGAVHEYVRVVEAYRENGKVKQRVVADLGRKDLLSALLPKLRRVLEGTPAIDGQTHEDLDVLDASTWGPLLVVRHLFEQLGLWSLFEEVLGRSKTVPYADRAFVLLANRLIRPESEHALASRPETDFVCDRQGRRFVPHWQREKRLEGKYVITTTEKDLDVPDAVRTYKDLTDVERGFRHLKDVLAVRPIYHRVEPRVRAHIFVAALALLLERLLERRLKEAGVDLSAPDALEAVATVRWVTFHLAGQPVRRGVSGGSPHARQVLKALGISDPKPPTPPENQITVI